MDCLKCAVLLPLIKGLDGILDKDNFKSYRPVSNLLYIGKVIKRVVGMQLNKRTTDNNLHSYFQHGYKKGHSTETLHLKVMNDLSSPCDE